MEPLISVVVPIYKVEQYLSRCIDSIVQQTYKNLQIILVDDGSPDRCGEICDEYEKRDTRIEVVHKTNGGLSDARNVGIEMSKGEYITFVDSDDWILSNFYQRCYETIKKYKADMVACPLCSFYEGETGVKHKMPGDDLVFDDAMAMESMFYSDGIPWCAPAKLYKKELLGEIRFPKGLLMEDKATTYKLFSKCKRIVFSRIEGYMYLIRPESIMHSAFTERNMRAFEIQKELNAFISEYYPDVIPTTEAYTCRVTLSMLCNMIASNYEDKQKQMDLLAIGYKYRNSLYNSKSIDYRFKILGHLIWPMYKIWGDDINSRKLVRCIAKYASKRIKIH